MTNSNEVLRVFDSYEEYKSARDKAAEKRHPGIRSDPNWFAKEEDVEYGPMNSCLYAAIKSACHYLFDEDAEYYTYHDSDFSGPSFECYVSVVNEPFALELAELLRGKLKDEFEDWTIIVQHGKEFGEETPEERSIVVMSDQILILRESLDAIG